MVLCQPKNRFLGVSVRTVLEGISLAWGKGLHSSYQQGTSQRQKTGGDICLPAPGFLNTTGSSAPHAPISSPSVSHYPWLSGFWKHHQLSWVSSLQTAWADSGTPEPLFSWAKTSDKSLHNIGKMVSAWETKSQVFYHESNAELHSKCREPFLPCQTVLKLV